MRLNHWLSLCVMAVLALVALGDPGIALAAAPDHEGRLVLYTSHPPDMVDAYAKRFGEKYGFQVTTVKAGTGELLQRVRAERERPQGDILWGGFADTAMSAPELFQSYRSKELGYIEPGMLDPNGFNSPFVGGTMVIVYNKKLVSAADAPKSWADLKHPKWAKKVIHADPAKSSSAYTAMLTWLIIYGKNDEGWRFVEELARNQVVVQKSSLVFTQVGNGEFPLGVTYEEGAFRYVLAGSLGMIYPTDGTPNLPDGNVIIKNGPNPKAARLFMDYLLSQEAQERLVRDFPGRRPTRKGVKLHPEMLPPEKFKVIDYDLAWASNTRNENLARWKEILIKTQ